MSSRRHVLGWFAVSVAAALVVASGCDGSSSKKVPPAGEAGEGGEAGAMHAVGEGGMAGTPAMPEGGAGGAIIGAGGEGGAPVVGAAGAPGAAGAETGEAGAAGATGTVLACTPTGTPDMVSIPDQPTLNVCRGAFINDGIYVSGSGSSLPFSCCSALGEVEAGRGFTSGPLSFTVPTDAAFGAQNLTLLCNGGAVPGALTVNVTETPLPQVTSFTDTLLIGEEFDIFGKNLANVTHVIGVSTTNSDVSFECGIETKTDTEITCFFGDDGVSGETSLIIKQDDCGTAFPSGTFTLASGG